MESLDVITTASAEHYEWGRGCDGWHLLKTNELSVIRERMVPGSSEGLHYHLKAQQLFYVLSGEARFEMNEAFVILKAGESLHVPPLAVHRISNEAAADLEFLVISQPKAHGDRVDIGQPK
jgi:mannose-6-phosphate isomerase-like protein (cupin superfamily)